MSRRVSRFALSAVFALTLCFLAPHVFSAPDDATETERKGEEAAEDLPVVPAALLRNKTLLPGKVNTKAKVYFIYESRSTCGICVREAPAIVKIYKGMHGKGAELVMLNIDATPEAAVKWAKSSKMKFPIFFRNSSSGIPFPYTGQGLLPCMVAVDADGNKLGEANADRVAGFLKDWKKLVRQVEKKEKKESRKAGETESTEA